jgi:hypothetical protein
VLTINEIDADMAMLAGDIGVRLQDRKPVIECGQNPGYIWLRQTIFLRRLLILHIPGNPTDFTRLSLIFYPTEILASIGMTSTDFILRDH